MYTLFKHCRCPDNSADWNPGKGRLAARSKCPERFVWSRPSPHHLQLSILYVDWTSATFPRLLQQGYDLWKGQRRPQGQQRAAKRPVIGRETLASAANVSRPLAGGGAPRLQKPKEERAKKTRTGKSATWTVARTSSSQAEQSARRAEAPSSLTTTVIRFFPWSISLETWTSCRWGDDAFLSWRFVLI